MTRNIPVMPFYVREDQRKGDSVFDVLEMVKLDRRPEDDIKILRLSPVLHDGCT